MLFGIICTFDIHYQQLISYKLICIIFGWTPLEPTDQSKVQTSEPASQVRDKTNEPMIQPRYQFEA